ncbi:MAG TPA: DUF499 domain-containing protein [Blastocatellia bacterium]
MLGLVLRKEFQGQRLKGTAIELANSNNTGATQIPAADFLEITYPSIDLLKAVEAVGPESSRPLVLIGERGQGKSHLMAALYHALRDPLTTRQWLKTWGNRISNPKIAELPLREGTYVITENMHHQRHKFLWDLLFSQHPHGNYIRGKWEGMGERKTDIPSIDLILELFRNQPTALILDEFQTWYEGLTNTKQYPWKNWAFNFIQMLSEIAKEHPDLLVLVVSVRNGNTDAYQQIHRVNPVTVDFKGPHAGKDRRRLLLHRLFENRLQIPTDEVAKAISAHIKEYFRLAEVPEAEQEGRTQEFVESWPFAWHLMKLLEDQVLVATAAQETRDLIKILASLFKQHGDNVPIITAADFRLDSEDNAITSLLDSVANHHHADLREKAHRNLSAVLDAVPKVDVPHLSEIVSALWLRSLAVGNFAGAEPATLQIDITRNKPIDDNAFQFELNAIIENSFNIHQEGNRLVFRQDENPQAKLLAYARNDKLFQDGSDLAYLAREIRFVLGGDDEVAKAFRVIVLPKQWESDPWTNLDVSEQPDHWDDRLPIVVLPVEPDKINEKLGVWLTKHLQRKRNTIRFLLPQAELENAYGDRNLKILARAAMKADEWKSTPEYKTLKLKYQKELRDLVKKRFDRFAILSVWNYGTPSRCQFHIEQIKEQGAKIPDAIEDTILKDLFIPEEFEALVRAAAENNDSIGKLLRELQEPRPGEQECIPWLGETQAKEKILRLCARGKIAINLRGQEYLQAQAGEAEEDVWKRIRGRLGTGKHLDETTLLLPQAVTQALGVHQPSPTLPPQPPALDGGSVQPVTDITSGGTITISPTDGSPNSPENPFNDGPSAKLTPLSSPATSALNLLGKTESWGIGTATKIKDATITISALSGAQLQKLLRDLPDGITYELSLQKEED